MLATSAAALVVVSGWAVLATAVAAVGWARSRRRPSDRDGDLIEAPAVTSAEPASRTELLLAGLSGALDHVNAAVVVCDARGGTLYRNAKGDVLMAPGLEGSILRDATTSQLAAARQGRSGQREVELFGPPASTFVIHSAPWGGSVDGRSGAVAWVEDLSDRRRLDQLRRDFVANVSHELKTPVGAVALLAETLQHELDDDADPDVVARLVRRVSWEMARMTATIDDLLALSRAEAGDELDFDLVPLEEVVDDAAAKLEPAAEARGIRIDVACKPDLVMLGDRRQLATAVVNLIDNAVKYSPEGRVVHVATDRCGHELRLSVTDEGIGIPARDLARVFERFYRVDRGRSRDTGGTGLGLSIVRHIAANHGGRVEVESHEGRGSRFVITLPSADSDEEGP